MKKLFKKYLFLVLFAALLIHTGSAFAFKSYLVDDVTIQSADGHYRYYSDVPESSYVNKLPAGYQQVYTEILQDIDSASAQLGDYYKFKLTKDLRFEEGLIIPEGSEVIGELSLLKNPIKVVRDGKIGISFRKILFPSGYELKLDKETFKIMPLYVQRVTRYHAQEEMAYTILISGGKYPIGRYLGAPIGLAVSSCAGLVGGLGYGVLVDDVPKNTGLGLLRGLGGKILHSMIAYSGHQVHINQGDEIRLVVDTRNVDHMLLLPQYLNLKSLITMASITNDQAYHDALLNRKNMDISSTTKVLSMYQKQVRNDNSDLDSNINLGRAYIKAGRYQKAINHLESVLNTYPDNADALYYTAEAQDLSGNLIQAKVNYKKSLESGFNSAECYLRLIKLSQKLGDIEDSKYYQAKYDDLKLVKN